jgi:WD40 repeat protein
MAFKAIVIFSPDGKTLAVTRPDDVQLWDTDTLTWTCRLTQKGARPLNPFMAPMMAFSPDSKTMATASQEETMRLWLWDTTSGSTLWTLQGEEIHFVAFSPDNKTLASASQSGSIALWDTATRSLQRNLSFEAGRGLYLRLTFSHDGKTLALSLLGAMLLWSTTTWECQELFVGASRLSLAFSPNDAYILSDYRPIRLSATSASSTQCFDEYSSETFLHFDDEWICLNKKQILWLPEDYRLSPSLVSVHGNKMAWANRGGRLSLLQVTGAEVMP